MLDELAEDEEVDKRGMEMNIPIEEFGVSFYKDKLSFEKLLSLIKRIEKNAKIKVWRSGVKYFPLTSSGQELGMAYAAVGFSFLPVEVVERPSEEAKPKPKEEKPLGYNELGAVFRGQAINFAPPPDLGEARMLREMMQRNLRGLEEMAQGLNVPGRNNPRPAPRRMVVGDPLRRNR